MDEDVLEELWQHHHCPERALAFELFQREIEALEAELVAPKQR